MKRLAVLSFVLFLPVLVFSQVKPVVIESTIDYQSGKLDGFIVSISEVKPDDVQKAWVKTLEKGTRSRADVFETYNISIIDAELDDISDSTLNAYSTIKAIDTLVILNVAFEIAPNEYISSSNYRSEAALTKLFLFDFARKQYMEVLKEKLKEEEKELKSLERDMNKAERDKEKMEKDIVAYDNDILQAEESIMDLEYDLDKKQEEIVAQKEKVSIISPSNEEFKKEAEDVLKDLEKDRKKIFRDIEKNKKDIVKFNSKIQKTELDIAENISEQEIIRQMISEQQIDVSKAEKKLRMVEEMEL